MKRLWSSRSALVIVALWVTAPFALHAQTAPKWAEESLKAWYAAFNAADAQGVARLYTEDAVVGKARGRAAQIAQLQAGFAATKSTCTGSFDGFQMAGATAIAWGHDTCTETPKAGGATKTVRSKWVSVYGRQPDGRWLMVRDEGEPLP